jgi:hypothetical protein
MAAHQPLLDFLAVPNMLPEPEEASVSSQRYRCLLGGGK